MDVARADLVDDLGGAVPQHALGTKVEELDDAFLVSGDDREPGAGQDRVLLGSGNKHVVSFLAHARQFLPERRAFELLPRLTRVRLDGLYGTARSGQIAIFVRQRTE